MAILDNILGGGDQENTNVSSEQQEFDSFFGTNPTLGFGASDVLVSESAESDDGDSEQDSFTGIGDIGFGASAPTVFGLSNSSSSESWSMSESDSDGGGLLGGLL